MASLMPLVTSHAEALNDFLHLREERLIRMIVLFGVISEEIETAFPGVDQDSCPFESNRVPLRFLD